MGSQDRACGKTLTVHYHSGSVCLFACQWMCPEPRPPLSSPRVLFGNCDPHRKQRRGCSLWTDASHLGSLHSREKPCLSLALSRMCLGPKATGTKGKRLFLGREDSESIFACGQLRQCTKYTISNCTHPVAVEVSLCKSSRHSSQKYSSGLMASSMIPTQPPCCHTLQISHCMNKPPASSGRGADMIEGSKGPLLLGFTFGVSPTGTGMPGYS